jgi:hypothetical protein
LLMVFAFAGDSTTTTFMNPFDRSARARRCLTQRDEVAGVSLYPAGEFQFKQEGGDGGG